MMDYVIIKREGEDWVNSNTIQGLLIASLPRLTRPAMRNQIDLVDGRAGDIVTELGYSAYDKPLGIALYGNYNAQEILDYFGSKGQIIFSDEIDKYYNYQILDAIELERVLQFRKGSVTLHIQPYKYLVGEEPIQLQSTNTISGEIVNFMSNTALPVTSLVTTIEAKQASGTPSPTNVLPITGWSSAKVYRTGKNLIPYPYYQNTVTTQGITFTVGADGTVTANGTATANAYFFPRKISQASINLPVGDYVMSCLTSTGSASTYDAYIYQTDGKTVITSGTDYGSGQTFTVKEKGGQFDVCIRIRSGQTVNNLVFKPMLRLASDTDSTWESPVNNTSETISLGQTVYGGTLNVTTGQLTIDRRYVEYDGSSDEPWAVINYGYRISLGTGNNGVTNSTKNIANWMVQADSAHNPTSSAGISGTFMIGGYCNINVSGISSITDVTTLKTYLASNPLQVVYELATPTTVQLTATEVTTLLGKNSIWSDCSEVEVEYGSATLITNAGNTVAQPIIRIVGQDTVNVIINDDNVLTLNMGSTQTEFVVDGEALEVYSGTELKNRQANGDYEKIALESGDNYVSVTGNVSNAAVERYTRWA